MRLRPLIATAIMLALLPAAPAFADDLTPTLPTPTPTPAATSAEEKVEEGLAVDGGSVRAIVELTDPAQHAPMAARAAEGSVEVLLQPQAQPFMVVEGTAEELAALAEDPRVTSIHRDRAYPPALASSIAQIGADQAHAAGHTGAGQNIAILDTGVDLDHPFLSGRVVAEACFSAVDAGVESLCPNGQTSQVGAGSADATTAKCLLDGTNLCDHGTHVAGIAAGTGGVAPGAGIVAVQVFSRVNDEDLCGAAACLLAYESSLRLALDHVASLTEPIAAVNLSLGGMPYETSCDDSEEAQVFKPKIDALLAKGVATVVAAGNEYFEGATFPACISSAVAVGANDDGDAIADFSNRGALLDLFAPGVDIESSVPDDQMTTYSGTSMATPHVAGALALLKAQSPDTPMPDLIAKLVSTGRPYVYQVDGAEVRTPRLDVAAAVTGGTPQPEISQSPPAAPDPADPGPGDPDPADPDPSPQPDPTGSGPTPEPEQPSDDPTPVPLPTVTVTVTITVTPTPAAKAAPVCTRGTAAKRLTAKQWAKEIHRGSGTMSDETLTCYLKLVGKASKVFPELTKASSLGKAYRVIKNTKTAKRRLDSALLTGWLNWAHGVNGTKTLKSSEKVRLAKKPTNAALKKAATKVIKSR
ncbi:MULTISPECIES: S8 family peptidase [Nonomuraea]|uniref:S8 family serine peptidase n=1 Tax=Nonomuraea ferruginea TaxID=46174 RepID=A0ABT4SZQ4_9ACTN|nr:S8 family serine peptidase [Nonomuraea ferruginea]MDA0642733.1 S8 family serine peptidase [Nonomuraea ferruginea]